MPNYSYNSLTITTNSPREFEKVIRGISGDGRAFDFNRLIPEPPELVAITSPNNTNAQEMIAKYGFPSWYEWRAKNWGTKWNSKDCELTIDSPTSASITFLTAWSPPMPVLEVLVETFRCAHIEFTYETDDGWWGELSSEDGKLLSGAEGEMNCEYRIRKWGECYPECEYCGTCDCECGCEQKSTATICSDCNQNDHQNNNDLPEFRLEKVSE